MSQFNISGYLQPYKKLSQLYAELISDFFPEYPAKIIIDKEYDFAFSKQLPSCALNFRLSLTREWTLTNLGTAYLTFQCNVSSAHESERIFFRVDPAQKVKIADINSRLINNNVFWKYYYFENLLESWYKVVKNYPTLRRSGINNSHSVYSPFSCIVSDKKFMMAPGFVKYSSRTSMQRDFDFCMIVGLDEDMFFSDEGFSDRINFHIDKLEINFCKKQIMRNVELNCIEFLDEKKDSLKCWIMQSTENNDYSFFDDIDAELPSSLILHFKFRGEKLTAKFSGREIEELRNYWRMFKKLEKF